MTRDVTDGKYVGPLTPEEVIEQFEYRAGIHQSYLELLEKEPNAGWEVYGSREWHQWAINGYEEAIRLLREKYEPAVVTRCTTGEAWRTILRSITALFR